MPVHMRRRFHTFDDWGVFGLQEQGEVIRLSNVGEGSCFVSIRDVCINMIKSIVSSCRANGPSIF